MTMTTEARQSQVRGLLATAVFFVAVAIKQLIERPERVSWYAWTYCVFGVSVALWFVGAKRLDRRSALIAASSLILGGALMWLGLQFELLSVLLLGMAITAVTAVAQLWVGRHLEGRHAADQDT